ncbi:hypothetical protein Shyhy02_63270 [Streptomyces hygroscopicus subsp. hygroscopicus]|nr:hypothetical protein Shyhy02_63270 [Streptomyces hygroscopicus subsp. hygroscopicus]
MNEMITVKRYLDRLTNPAAPFVFCVFNNQDLNQDLNQVTWEQRAMAGDPKYPGSPEIPDVPYAAYTQLLGLKGTVCQAPRKVGDAWDEALAADKPVVLEFKVDNEIAPIPPHIMASLGKKATKAALHDPRKVGITARSVRQKITEYAGRLPGRGEK